MKIKLVVASLLFLVGINLFSQDNPFIKMDAKPKIEIGMMYVYNKLNEDRYFNYMSPGEVYNSSMDIIGLNLKLQFETKIDYLDAVMGALIMNDMHENISGWNPGQTNSSHYILDGGGVYFALSPKIKGRYIGLTSEFGVGVFSFKEYHSIYNNITEPYADVHDLKASSGLGAISSVGMYVNIGKIGINPSVFAIFSGGTGASFTFYGFNLPITFQF